MSFTDQKPRIATEQDLDAPWEGTRRKYFRCKLCGYTFKVGDYWRWVFVPGLPNIIVCKNCDTPNVIDKWRNINQQWEDMKKESPFWWFITKLEEWEHEASHAYYQETEVRESILRNL